MNGRTALAAGGTALLLLAGSLLPQALFAAQDQVDQAGVRSVRDQQLSLDLSEEESGFWSRLKAIGGGNFISTTVGTDYMTSTEEEIMDAVGELMADYQALAAELGGTFGESGAFVNDITCAVIWDADTSSSFRVWYVFCHAEDTLDYFSVILDDETALPLGVYCSDAREEPLALETLEQAEQCLEPFADALAAEGVTGVRLNHYGAYDTDTGYGVVFDLEREDKDSVEVLVWIDLLDNGVSINLYRGEETQAENEDAAVEEPAEDTDAATDTAVS